MDRTAPAAHAGHDEALIARLYGGDVDDAGRARALVLVSECPECESLFTDFGAIAAAGAALPVPPRPRDFSLTEADAARLRGKARGRWRLLGLGLRRSLGGSLAALGIFGVILTGTTSILGGAASTTGGGYALSPERAAATGQQGAAVVASAGDATSKFGPASVGTAGPASTAALATLAASRVPMQDPEPSAGNLVTDTASSGAPAASPSVGSNDLAAASPAVAQAADSAGSGATGTEAAGIVSSGLDARLVWLIGFGVLFVLGLGLAILPVRRRSR